MVSLSERKMRVDNWIDTADSNYVESDTELESGSEVFVEQTDADEYYDVWCQKYISFTDNNPTTQHVVHSISELLEAHRFVYVPENRPIDEKLARQLQNGGSFYTKRADLSLVAFVVGGKWEPEHGIGAIGSHIDALTAKLKPFSVKNSVDGYQLLGVANYAGTLNERWLDRDLGIGGTVLVKQDGQVRRKLVSSGSSPIATIPSLAEHFGSIADGPYNKETQMVPIIGYGDTPEPTEDEKDAPLIDKHPLALLRFVAARAGCKLQDIIGLELELYDVQAASRGGIDDEFLFAPRIDDRLCSFTAINALILAASEIQTTTKISEWKGLHAVLLADNEEVGSATRTGAKGKLLNNTISRVLAAKNFEDGNLGLAYANSLILSADVTHALNPNFKLAYLENNFPVPNKGLTIKMEAKCRVATDSVGTAVLEKIAKKNNLQLQLFHIRNDAPSGGTIGPILAVETGARIVDVGLAQLSMHSIRALCGYQEVGIGVKTFEAFFRDWSREYGKARDL